MAYHGGNLAAARLLFPGAPEPWIDLSTGINPTPYPMRGLSPEVWQRLPEPGHLRELETVAAARYRAPQHAVVVAAPGTQAIIQLLPRLHRARTVGILGFTYSEYERVWSEAGVIAREVDSFDALAGCDVAVVVNPNNPDGRLIEPNRLLALADHLAERGGLLIVDEAFMDVLPAGNSLVPLLPRSGAVVLRSFGKTYGLAGVRLGFAITNSLIAAALRTALGPWAVSGPAIEIGRVALGDEAWLAHAIENLSRRAAGIDGAFKRSGARLVGGTPLFRLVSHPQAEKLFHCLGREGVLVRHFPTRPGWLRAGLPADDASEQRFNAALDQVLPRI